MIKKRSIPDLTLGMISKAFDSEHVKTGSWRLLKRVPLSDEVQPIPARASSDMGDEVSVIFVSIETSGPSIDAFEAIHFEYVKCLVSPSSGKIAVALERGVSNRMPSGEFHKSSISRNGIEREDLEGYSFDNSLYDIFNDDPIMVSLNPAFERPFFDQVLPDVSDLRWASVKDDFDWPGFGFSDWNLDHLLLRSGFFIDRGMLQASEAAGVGWFLHVNPEAMKAVLESAESEYVGIRVFGAPYEVRHSMLERDYTWVGDRMAASPHWVKDVDASEAGDEKEFLAGLFHDGDINSTYLRIDSRKRFKSLVV